MMKTDHQIDMIVSQRKMFERVDRSGIQTEVSRAVTNYQSEVRKNPVAVKVAVRNSAVKRITNQVIHSVHIHFSGNEGGEERIEIYVFCSRTQIHRRFTNKSNNDAG